MSRYSLSKDLSPTDIECLYREVVLDQDFYDQSYGEDWNPQPYQILAKILTSLYGISVTHLDMGCGVGFLVGAMRDLGVKSFGVDFSEALIDRAAEAIRPYISVSSAETALSKIVHEKVSLVTFTEVFEHLPYSVLVDSLNKLRQIDGVEQLFLTIPSFGIDGVINSGIMVGEDNPQWLRDMRENRLFKNIVLEFGRPHHGHITLASYRWWSEFLLSCGWVRDRECEVIIRQKWLDEIKNYHWNPYCLVRGDSGTSLSSMIQSGRGLRRGWHDFEENLAGRWTDGFAEINLYIDNEDIRSIKLTVAAPPINIIEDWPLYICFQRLWTKYNESEELSFFWVKVQQWVLIDLKNRGHYETIKLQIDESKIETPVPNSGTPTNGYRLLISSPNFIPQERGFSADTRRLSLFINEIKFCE